MCDPLSPLNALAMSPNYDMVVVGGRSVFKIVSLSPNGEMKEEVNLRPGKQNMNYSVHDVEWHPTNKELICSAPTNGAICLWNCETKGKKLTHVLREHTRTVNKVSWHCEGHTFYTGSQDTHIKMWDTRDLDRSMATLVDKKNDGEVRFVECHHSDPNRLVSSLDNGVVQIWDLRRLQPCLTLNSAHQGVILAARWHPEARDIIATGGRDGQIKIWDLASGSGSGMAPIACLNTPVGVGNLIWRPRTSQILSVGIGSNFDMLLWNLSSPGVPLASIEKHSDVCKGICFAGSNNVIVSCGMDGHLFRSDLLTDSSFPHRKLRMASVSWNVQGDVVTAMERPKKKFGSGAGPLISPFKYTTHEKRSSIAREKHSAISELSTPQIGVKSLPDLAHVLIKLGQMHRAAPRHITVMTPTMNSLPVSSPGVDEVYGTDVILYFAKNYRFQGDSIDALCVHNAQVARQINYLKIASIWDVLRIFADIQWRAQCRLLDEGECEKAPTSLHKRQTSFPSSDFKQNPLNEIDAFEAGFNVERKKEKKTTEKKNSLVNHYESKARLEGQNFEDFLDEDISTFNPANFNKNPSAPRAVGDQSATAQSHHHNMTAGPSGAHSDSPSNVSSVNPGTHVPRMSGGFFPTVTTSSSGVGVANGGRYVVPNLFASPELDWQDDSVMVDALLYQVDRGDLQTPIFAYLIFYDYLKDMVDENQALLWFHSYIDILRRLKQFTLTAHIIKYCPLDRIRERSSNMTKYLIHCANCNKVLSHQASFCPKCAKIILCVICHQPMKGHIVWCQGCGHGGHPEHMTSWFANHQKCPSGCSHICQYRKLEITPAPSSTTIHHPPPTINTTHSSSTNNNHRHQSKSPALYHSASIPNGRNHSNSTSNSGSTSSSTVSTPSLSTTSPAPPVRNQHHNLNLLHPQSHALQRSSSDTNLSRGGSIAPMTRDLAHAYGRPNNLLFASSIAFRTRPMTSSFAKLNVSETLLGNYKPSVNNNNATESSTTSSLSASMSSMSGTMTPSSASNSPYVAPRNHPIDNDSHSSFNLKVKPQSHNHASTLGMNHLYVHRHTNSLSQLPISPTLFSVVLSPSRPAK